MYKLYKSNKWLHFEVIIFLDLLSMQDFLYRYLCYSHCIYLYVYWCVFSCMTCTPVLTTLEWTMLMGVLQKNLPVAALVVESVGTLVSVRWWPSGSRRWSVCVSLDTAPQDPAHQSVIQVCILLTLYFWMCILFSVFDGMRLPPNSFHSQMSNV